MEQFKSAVGSFYANYFVFQGRASRAQYWWVVLYMVVVTLVLEFFAMACGQGTFGYYVFAGLISLFGLANFIPNIMIAVRRMHDIGKGGGWIFINLIPVIGIFWYLYLVLQPSEGPNRFGPAPLPLK
ncbi:MAG: DUF805 domain-containing protein [Muribaculaceae bacterium]|nr:DUF805 domain-containing protein [Muribaculaceae bacterium]